MTVSPYELKVNSQGREFYPESILNELSNSGFVLLKTLPEKVEFTMKQLGELLGKETYVIPLAHNSDESGPSLPWHIDGYYQNPLPAYFMLGCRSISCSGGATLLKDGRLIASQLLEQHPNLEHVHIHYERTVPGSYKERSIPLIQYVDSKPILAYRSNTPKLPGLEQTVVNLGGFSDDTQIYSIIDRAIEESPIALKHDWSAGDVLVAHNLAFLHSRSAYSGTRDMLRAQCFSS